VRAAIGTFVLRSPARRLSVVAAGKAAWPMAQGLAAAGTAIASGLIVGPRASSLPVPPPWQWLAGSHPVPDAASAEAGTRALSLATASRGGLFLVLLSGGASSMLALPAPGISLADKVATSAGLMRAGAAIAELNAVRKHLSAIKGGRLAVAADETLTLALSDVDEDDPAVIGSGPTVADPTTFADALRIVTHRLAGAAVPPTVLSHLERGARGQLAETPKPGDPRLSRSEYHVLANRHTAMEGAAHAARSLGIEVRIVHQSTHGEAREAGRQFAADAIERAGGRPLCVLASGETTVRVAGRGRGGRNQEFALGAAAVLRNCPGAMLASVGTDGIDGPTDAAGAIVDATTERRACAAGLSIEAALDDNNAYPLFGRLGDLVTWGATGTNVGDLHVLLIA
jgi:glycerate 2-kinase